MILGAIFKIFPILTGILFAVGNPQAAQQINDFIWNGFGVILGVIS